MRPTGHVFQIYRMADEPLVRWRMVSPNGRCLARSTGPSQPPDELRVALHRLVTHAADSAVHVRATRAYRWHWSLTLDGVEVAEGPTDQDRRVRCVAAAQAFTTALPTAVVAESLIVFRQRDRARRLPPVLV